MKEPRGHVSDNKNDQRRGKVQRVPYLFSLYIYVKKVRIVRIVRILYGWFQNTFPYRYLKFRS